jgi:hypothetical protein
VPFGYQYFLDVEGVLVLVPTNDPIDKWEL